jgi:hypothetical protein
MLQHNMGVYRHSVMLKHNRRGRNADHAIAARTPASRTMAGGSGTDDGPFVAGDPAPKVWLQFASAMVRSLTSTVPSPLKSPWDRVLPV